MTDPSSSSMLIQKSLLDNLSDTLPSQPHPISQPIHHHKKLLCCIPIHPSFNTQTLLAFISATMLTITLFVYLNASTGFVLSLLLNVHSGLGQVTGSLAFYDELASIPLVLIWGSLSDFLSRKIVYTLGFLIMGMALLVYPFTPNVYPTLLLARLLFAIGGAACSTMLTAVLSDCSHNTNPGLVTGLVGLCSGLGALLAVFVLLPIPAFLESGVNLALPNGVQVSFLIVAGFTIAFALCFYFLASGLVSSSQHHDNQTDQSQHPLSFSSMLTQTKLGLLAAKDLRILTAYATGFCARGNTAIITIFIPLWVNQYYISNNLCQVPGLDPSDESGVKQSCRAAFTQSSILGGVTQTFALIGAPIFGMIFHTLRKQFTPILLACTCMLAALGYLLLFLMPSPLNPAVYVIVCLVGFAEIGTVITSSATIAASNMDIRIRGSVAGAFSYFGALGILICTKLGGYLFDSWTLTAPFFLMSMLHLCAACIASFVATVEYLRVPHVEQGVVNEPLTPSS